MSEETEHIRVESEMLTELRAMNEQIQKLQRCRHLLPSGECALYQEVGTLREKLQGQTSLANRLIGAGSILGFLFGVFGGWVMGLFGHRP